MKLDGRIIEGKKPLDCFDVDIAKQFIGKKGYVTDFLQDFRDLSKVKVEELRQVLHTELFCYLCGATGRKYFLPVEWVKKEPEKYRPYRLREFLHKFKFGGAIYIRPKNSKTNEERMVIFSEYRTELCKDESNNAESVCLTGIEHHLKSVVCLGIREYDLTTLFENYEYFDADGKEWKTFGVKE